MLGVLALIPHTTSVYELLPLFLVPQTKRSFALLLGLSYLATAIVYIRFPFRESVSATLDARWPYFLVLVWLPALVMALKPSVPINPPASVAEERTSSEP